MSIRFRDPLLNARSGKLAFFVGAGISHDHPSNMPLGMDLKRYPFEALATRQQRLGTRLKKLVAVGSKVTLTDFGINLLRRVLPELLFQIVHESTEPSTDDFVFRALSVLRVEENEQWRRKPNTFHAVLAQGFTSRRVPAILTTNFDNLIEIAVGPSSAGHVFSDDDIPDYPAIRRKLPILVHLHGFIEDASSIVARLAQVQVGISKKRENLIRWFLREFPTCFIGYSGLDPDISSVIMSTKTEQPVYWFCFNDADLTANAGRLSEILSGKQYSLLTDPSEFFVELKRAWRGRSRPAQKTKWPPYRNFYKKWAESLPEWTVHSIMGRILQELGHHRLASRCYAQAIKVGNSEWALALNNLRASESCLGLGDLSGAKVYLASAEVHAQNTEDAPLRAAIISRRGDTLYRQFKKTRSSTVDASKLYSVLRMYGEAIEVLTSISPQGFREKSEIAYLHSQTGIICKQLSRFKDSIESFSTAYRVARDIGHLWLKGHALIHRSRALTRCGHVREAGLDALVAVKTLQSLGVRTHALASMLEALDARLQQALGDDDRKEYPTIFPLSRKATRLPFYIGYEGVRRGGHFVFLPELDELIYVGSFSDLHRLCVEHLINRRLTVKPIVMTECDYSLLELWRPLFGFAN